MSLAYRSYIMEQANFIFMLNYPTSEARGINSVYTNRMEIRRNTVTENGTSILHTPHT